MKAELSWIKYWILWLSQVISVGSERVSGPKDFLGSGTTQLLATCVLLPSVFTSPPPCSLFFSSLPLPSPSPPCSLVPFSVREHRGQLRKQSGPWNCRSVPHAAGSRERITKSSPSANPVSGQHSGRGSLSTPDASVNEARWCHRAPTAEDQQSGSLPSC